MSTSCSRSWILQTIQSTISELDTITEDSVVALQRAEALEWRVELVYRDLIAKEVSPELGPEEVETLPFVAEAYSKLRRLV